MWTPACLPIRPAPLWSVSESTCWTWFPPVLSPKQPTHGNNAILLPTDIITITPLNINNSHSHDHSNPFYGLCLWPKRCGGRIILVFLLDGGVPSALPQIFLLPSSLPESFIPKWSCAATALASEIWGICQIEFGYLFLRVYMGMYTFTNCSSDVASPSLPVYWLNLSVAPRGNISPACGLGRDKIIITITHHFKIFALRPPPPSPVWAGQTQAHVAGRTELNWRPHHGDCGRAPRTIHEIITASALQKWIKWKKRTVKIYLHTDFLFSLTHSAYSREVDVCWIILYGWMLGFLSFFFFCKSYTVFGILCSLILWKWPLVEVWIYRLMLLLRWFYICWVPCCGLLLNTLFFLRWRGRIKIKVSLTHVKTQEHMFGGLFLLNIVKK